MDLKEMLRAKFVNVDEVAEILEIGYKTKKNVFMYGRGGHAKSEMMEAFLDHVDPGRVDSFVQACGEGLTEEKLFGGLDLKKFQETGEIEYLVRNSFMNYKYVVFEELLDSRMNVLLSLKDILTSGKFRQGSQQFPIKTEFIVCLTNRTKQEVAEDNSVKALLERFPLEIKVEWPRYEGADYSSMFKLVLGKEYWDVAEIVGSINESGDFISPRTAIHMAQVYQATNSLTALKYFGATESVIKKLEKKQKEKKEIDYLEGKKEQIDQVDIDYPDTTLEHVKKRKQRYKTILEDLSKKSYTDKAFTVYGGLKTDLDTRIKDCTNTLIEIIENE